MSKWRVKMTKKKDKPDDPAPVNEDDLFDTKAAADAEKAKKKNKAKKDEVVTQHLCAHAAGEAVGTWYDCQADPRAQYEIFVKKDDGVVEDLPG
jgi:hypothetical protein